MASRPLRLATALLLLLTLLSGCSMFRPAATLPVYKADGIQMTIAVRDGKLARYDGHDWQPLFWNGINLGATTPGYFPGQLSPKEKDYRRWFAQMKAMNVDVVRIYTILPPAFYDALADFNRGRPDPLLFLQGIWSPEEELIGEREQGNDAFRTDITQTFLSEISDAVKVVWGDHTLPKRRGHASGRYRSDVSRYLAGWLVGTEWHQRAVKVTNDAHPTMAPYAGKYFSAKPGAAAFESWLARMLDHLAAEVTARGWQHPISFVNWPTTDPLSHPNEANREEDLVSLDPMLIAPTPAWKAGYFAAYHVYPHYPDFMRYEARYQGHINPWGERDPYAAYLRELRAHHAGIPLIVAEFGVPSSRGMAHRSALERNQGMHTEQEQAAINAQMLALIHHERYDGALLFTWQDEWHKFTWNTVGLELPWEHRAFWRNRLTNEEHFGVIAVEPGKRRTPVYLDGKTDDWRWPWQRTSRTYPDFTLSVRHDEADLYLLVTKKEGRWDFSRESLVIGFATLGKGATQTDRAPGVTFTAPPETLAVVSGPDQARLYVNSAYDQHTFLWGHQTKIIPTHPDWQQAKSGHYLPWMLLLNRRLLLPETGEVVEPEEVEVGILRRGITDPKSASFNNLADWYYEGAVLEMRIPWMLLGFTDPSRLEVWQYPYEAGKMEGVRVPGVQVEPYLIGTGTGGAAGASPLLYKWRPWEIPTWHERPKAAYQVLGDAFTLYPKPR